jgi:putative methyltransferase (TIGR04325 family)
VPREKLIKSVLVRIENRFSKKKTYPAYTEALRDCPREGYEDEELAKVVYLKTKLYKENLFSNLRIQENINVATKILQSLLGNIHRDVWVLDFGGACGALYFTLKSLLGNKYRLNWVVVETKLMCSYGIKLENEELRFFDDIEKAKLFMPKLDLINVSGALQYTAEPYKFLGSILGCGAENILFSRMVFNLGNSDLITIQKSMLSWHGKGRLFQLSKDKETRCPITAMQKSRFDGFVQRKYDYLKTFTDNSGLIKVNSEPIIGLGLLCKIKEGKQ